MKVTVDKIKEIIKDTGVLTDSKDLKANIPLTEQGFDSLDLVNIFLQVEEEFNIKIPDEDISKVQNIEDLANYVNTAKS